MAWTPPAGIDFCSGEVLEDAIPPDDHPEDPRTTKVAKAN